MNETKQFKENNQPAIEIRLDAIIDALVMWQAGMSPNLNKIDAATERIKQYQKIEDERDQLQHEHNLIQMALGQIDRNIAECDERINARIALMAENGPDRKLEADNRDEQAFRKGLIQARGLIEKARK